MKKITKFFIGASRIISDRILNYFLVFVVGKVKFFLINMNNYLDTDKRITARDLNRLGGGVWRLPSSFLALVLSFLTLSPWIFFHLVKVRSV